ncbi:MAG: ABC transporter substrate-binding protein [Bdellovibrionales bacterium]|jgi:branched-chain amino acid transport system substrate-binding protein
MAKLAGLVLGLALLASPVLASPATGEPIKIGDITSYSKITEYIVPYQNAVRLAVDEINETGGINGRPLDLISIDSKGDPAAGVKAAEDLVAREKVSVLLDCNVSNATMAISGWAKQNHIPLINSCATADTIMWDNGHDYIFRTAAGSYMWVSAAIEEAVKQYGDKIKGKRWAVVAPSYESGRAAVKMAKYSAEKLGLNAEWVVEQWPALGKLEAGPTVAALQHAQPDVLFIYLFSSDLAKIVREGNKRGLFKDRIIISPIAGWPESLDMLGKETPSGWFTVGFPVDDIKDEGFVKFRQAYNARFKDRMKFYALSGYSAVQAVAKTLRQAGASDPVKIREALEQLSFPTPFGEESFRKVDHTTNAPFWVGMTGVKDGKGALLNWHVEHVYDHSPPDAWILEQRAKAAEGKKDE